MFPSWRWKNKSVWGCQSKRINTEKRAKTWSPGKGYGTRPCQGEEGAAVWAPGGRFRIQEMRCRCSSLSAWEILRLLGADPCSLTIMSSILGFNFLLPVLYFFFLKIFPWIKKIDVKLLKFHFLCHFSTQSSPVYSPPLATPSFLLCKSDHVQLSLTFRIKCEPLFFFSQNVFSNFVSSLPFCLPLLPLSYPFL